MEELDLEAIRRKGALDAQKDEDEINAIAYKIIEQTPEEKKSEIEAIVRDFAGLHKKIFNGDKQGVVEDFNKIKIQIAAIDGGTMDAVQEKIILIDSLLEKDNTSGAFRQIERLYEAFEGPRTRHGEKKDYK